MQKTGMIRWAILSLLLLSLISGIYAQSVQIEVPVIGFKVISQDYISKYFNIKFEKNSETNYTVFLEWKDLELKNEMESCLLKYPDSCGTTLKDQWFSGKEEVALFNDFQDMQLNGIPITILGANLSAPKKIKVDGNSASFEIDLNSSWEYGEQIKIGYETTIIELGETDVNIIIEPETIQCLDGECEHPIEIVNSTDANFCFNSLDIYGTFDPTVTNVEMWFLKDYPDGGSAWKLLTTQECILPQATGYLEYRYTVPLFSEGKWDFHFWYGGTEYVIDPFYSSMAWEFAVPEYYDYNSSQVTIDGNAFLDYVSEHAVSTFVETGSTTSTTLVDLNGSELTIQTDMDLNIFLTLSTSIYKTTGGNVDEDINVAILIDGNVVQNVVRTVSDDYENGSVQLNGIAINYPQGEHTITAQLASETGESVVMHNTTIVAMLLQEDSVILPNGSVSVSDTTTSGTLEDIDGSDFNITLTEPAKIFGIMSVSLSSSIGNVTSEIAVQINGIDGNVIYRDLSAGSVGSATTIYTSEELPAGSYMIVGRWATSGGTLTGFVNNLSAFAMQSDMIDSKVIASDTTTSPVLEDIDNLFIEESVARQSIFLALLTTSAQSSATSQDMNLSISIDGVDYPPIQRHFTTNNDDGAISLVATGLINAGDHNFVGRIAVSGGTLTVTNPILTVHIHDLIYPTGENPTITPLYAINRTDGNTILAITNFEETAFKPAGTEIKYQITDDNGSTFYWWNGGSWASASDTYSQSNTASDINSNLGSFTVGGTEEIKFRAYLNTTDLNYTPFLDRIDLNYEYGEPLENQPPSVPVLIAEIDQNIGTDIDLNWNTSTDPESDDFNYNIRIGTTSEGTEIADLNVDVNGYNAGVLGVDIYYWSVRACDDNNCSNWSSEDIFEIINQPPTIPTLVAEPDQSYGTTQVDLNWNASTDPENNTIRYHLNVGTSSGASDTADVNTFILEDMVSGLSEGQYFWRVRACDNNYSDGYNNCSDWSIEDDFNVLINQPPPIPVLDDEPNQFEGTLIVLTWGDSSDPEGHDFNYNLRIGTTSMGNDIADLNQTGGKSWFNAGYLDVNTYFWSIRACDEFGACSNWATEDDFNIQQSGIIYVTANVIDDIPYITDAIISTNEWNGVDGINVNWYCNDPNGISDVNRAEIDIYGTDTTEDILANYIAGTGYATDEISSYITSYGEYQVHITCVDDLNRPSLTTILDLNYSFTAQIYINNNTYSTRSPIVDLTPIYNPNAVYMAFSCDNTNWTTWYDYDTNYNNFNLFGNNPTGCRNYGVGEYTVYVSFSDANFLLSYTQDSILYDPVPTDTNQTFYLSPEETQETSQVNVGLMGLSDAGGLGTAIGLIVIAIIGIILIVFLFNKYKESKRYDY